MNHAFASAVAPSDEYDEARVKSAIGLLGQDPDGDLLCAYCGGGAETWDHVFATVRNSAFSGYGHRIGNLLPCCKPCNSAKGNRSWQAYLNRLPMSEADRSARAMAIQRYLSALHSTDGAGGDTDDHRELDRLRQDVLRLMGEADEIAARIRSRRSGTLDADRSR